MLNHTKLCLYILLNFIFFKVSAQQQLVVINDLKTYKNQVEANPNMQLIEIKRIVPNITLDIKYATKNNFANETVYSQARSFARKPVVDSLYKIEQELNKKGLGLKIFDGYRPYAVTVKFWNITPNDKKDYVANPKTGSRHNRGCAVDLTLIDYKTKKELVMPTPYDSFAPEASPTFENVSALAKKNRDFLIETMTKYGFKVYKNEWWHFDFVGWENYPLMDIPFEKL
jgi:D-alanyl-D-alanine dipeptidase